MSGERDLQVLLKSAKPELRPGTFVFVVVHDEAHLETLAPDATIREPEGLTAVGLTAAVSTALARAGISCNVIAGYHHDHLLVPADRADEALHVLAGLSR